jgi:SAM-dependent methyltransferase
MKFKELKDKDKIKKLIKEELLKHTGLTKLLKYLSNYNIPINNNSKIITKYGRLKINSDKVYDFGGSEYPLPNSIVVDITPPEGNNKFIEKDLENEFSLPPKDFINLTSVLHFITNKSNLIKSINNSLKPGGLLIVKTSLKEILKFLPYLSSFTPIEAQILKEDILSEDGDYDLISIVFKK